MTGLSSPKANQLLAKFGLNEIKSQRKFSNFKLLLSQFKSPLIYILVIAGLVTLFLADYTDSIVIFAAVILNTALGFYQEMKAQKSLQALKDLVSPKVKVIRDGQQQIIEASRLVPGDLVILTIGDRVPADGVLVESIDLSVNEAILTGESMPVSKNISSQEPDDGSRVFMGTIIVTGIGKMQVVKTGMDTKMGKIGKAVEEVEEEKIEVTCDGENLDGILGAIRRAHPYEEPAIEAWEIKTL